jgi:hypothetical protein
MKRIIFGTGVIAVLAAAVAAQLPEIRRYMKIRSM